MPTPAALAEACRKYADRPPDDEEAAELEARRELKAKVKATQERLANAERSLERAEATARRRMWRDSRVVACTAAAAVEVTRRLQVRRAWGMRGWPARRR